MCKVRSGEKREVENDSKTTSEDAVAEDRGENKETIMI